MLIDKRHTTGKKKIVYSRWTLEGTVKYSLESELRKTFQYFMWPKFHHFSISCHQNFIIWVFHVTKMSSFQYFTSPKFHPFSLAVPMCFIFYYCFENKNTNPLFQFLLPTRQWKCYTIKCKTTYQLTKVQRF